MINHKRITLTLLCSIQLLFAATSEQIEEYLSISKADRELIEIEQAFDSMRKAEDNSSQEISQIYELYLEEHLSSNEIEELLTLYRTPIMQRYVVEMDMVDIPKEEMETFLLSLKENPLSTERSEIINNILKHTIDEKQIVAFYKSMTQRYQPKNKKINNDKNKTKEVDNKEEKFLNMMKRSAKNNLLYGTQVLSLEEMNELDTALESSILTKVLKVESDAMIHVMNTFIQGISSEPIKEEEANLTKK